MHVMSRAVVTVAGALWLAIGMPSAALAAPPTHTDSIDSVVVASVSQSPYVEGACQVFLTVTGTKLPGQEYVGINVTGTETGDYDGPLRAGGRPGPFNADGAVIVTSGDNVTFTAILSSRSGTALDTYVTDPTTVTCP